MSLTPWGPLILYPFTLFTTWVHEMGHGLTALAFGGETLITNFDALESALAGDGGTRIA